MSSKQQVISHRGQDENGSEMHKNEKCVQNYCYFIFTEYANLWNCLRRRRRN